MIGILEGDETGSFWLAGLLAVLDCHLDSNLHRGGPVIREENPLQCARGKEIDQPFCQFRGPGIGEPQKRGVRDLIELGPEGCIEAGMAVPVDISPDTRVAIEVTPSS